MTCKLGCQATRGDLVLIKRPHSHRTCWKDVLEQVRYGQDSAFQPLCPAGDTSLSWGLTLALKENGPCGEYQRQLFLRFCLSGSLQNQEKSEVIGPVTWHGTLRSHAFE